MRKSGRSGFTLVELMVVISILAVLSAALLAGYGKVQRGAWQSRSRDLAVQTATAWTIYLQTYKEYPDSVLGVVEQGMVPTACKVLGEARMMDLSYDGQKNADKQRDAELKVGLMSVWGQRLFKQGKLGSADAKRHLVQFRLDSNYDGMVDQEDDPPAPAGLELRAAAIAWTWGPEGQPQNADKKYFDHLITRSW